MFLFTSGKRQRQGLNAASNPGISVTPGRLIYVVDPATGLRFLIDTGASVSVIPPRTTHRSNSPAAIALQAANGSSIKTFGERPLLLNLGLRRNFEWIFVIADVKNPILGMDFLAAHNLQVDLQSACLRDPKTSLSTTGDFAAAAFQSEMPTITHLPEDNPAASLLQQFPELIPQPNAPLPPVKHTVQHVIETNGQPQFARPRRFCGDKLETAKTEFQHLLRQRHSATHHESF